MPVYDENCFMQVPTAGMDAYGSIRLSISLIKARRCVVEDRSARARSKLDGNELTRDIYALVRTRVDDADIRVSLR